MSYFMSMKEFKEELLSASPNSEDQYRPPNPDDIYSIHSPSGAQFVIVTWTCPYGSKDQKGLKFTIHQVMPSNRLSLIYSTFDTNILNTADDVLFHLFGVIDHPASTPELIDGLMQFFSRRQVLFMDKEFLRGQ